MFEMQIQSYSFRSMNTDSYSITKISTKAFDNHQESDLERETCELISNFDGSTNSIVKPFIAPLSTRTTLVISTNHRLIPISLDVHRWHRGGFASLSCMFVVHKFLANEVSAMQTEKLTENDGVCLCAQLEI